MSKSVKIALLGFTHTGKTCIAAGFANKNGYSGVNQSTRNFLKEHGEKIEKMRQGDFEDPFPPTDLGKPATLHIFDSSSRNEFIFAEYAGEMLTKNNGYIDTLDIPNQDGILLLLSAKEPIGNDKETRIQQIKDCFAEILIELKGTSKPIIFVITAADELLKNTDHKDFFKLKNYIEERIFRHDLQITSTKFVSVIEEYENRKIWDDKGTTFTITSPDKVVSELVQDIAEKNKTKKESDMKKIIFAVAVVVILVVVYFFMQKPAATSEPPSKCQNCENNVEPGKELCENCEETSACPECGSSSKNCLCINNTVEKLAKRLSTTPSQYDKAMFDELRKICRDIKNNSKLQETPMRDFAIKYLDWYETGITVKITQVEFSRNPKSKGTVKLLKYRLCTENENGDEIEINAEVKEKSQNRALNGTIKLKPWQRFMIAVQWERSRKKTYESFDRTNVHYEESPYEISADSIDGFKDLKFHWEISTGKTFPQLLNEVFGTARPDAAAIKGQEE